MTAQFNASAPALTNTIAADVPDIEENFAWFKLLVQMAIGWKTSTIATVGPGVVTRRPQFAYTDGNTISIGAGGYFHDGTVRQWVFWDAAITFEAFRPGAGGSNADNAAASASAWHYIYIDDTAVVTNASPELVAACFLNSTTAPTFSATKHGWYNGADRCIFAVLTDGSNNIYEFFHDGGDCCFFADAKTEASAVTPSNTWTDVNCASSVPGFSTKAFFSIMMVRAATSTTLELRTNGQSGTVGHRVGSVSETAAISYNDTMVLMDSSQIFEVKTADASANEVTVYTNGWFFPVGM